MEDQGVTASGVVAGSRHGACPHCGQAPYLDVLELFVAERTALLDACCEGAHAEALDTLQACPDQWAPLLAELAGVRARALPEDLGLEVAGRYGNGGVTLDFGLHLHEVDWATAVPWVGAHHRHNEPPTGWRWGHGVSNGVELVGLATVGRPVARMLDASCMVEVTRVCISPDVPAALGRNACSMLYGAAARRAKAEGYECAITYTRHGELATSVLAAGWVPTHVTKIDRRGWSRAGRRRAPEQRVRKLRWERGLTRAAERDVQARRLPAAKVHELTHTQPDLSQ